MINCFDFPVQCAQFQETNRLRSGKYGGEKGRTWCEESTTVRNTRNGLGVSYDRVYTKAHMRMYNVKNFKTHLMKLPVWFTRLNDSFGEKNVSTFPHLQLVYYFTHTIQLIFSHQLPIGMTLLQTSMTTSKRLWKLNYTFC